MAPQKRRQPQLAEDPSDPDDDDRSSIRSTSKRARIEETLASEGTAVYESDNERTELEIRYTQRIKDQNSNAQQNEPAEGGVVTEVICENFMCHRYLKIEFGPFMNFIIGHNGSGKSAILTALTLCLGGKASSTNRGNSMKSFIKEGEDTACITVKLKNGGEGYRQDVYGNIIAIERLFSRDGGSHYKLKSKDGKIVSSKRDELDSITDFYGLQIDNPMTILTQDQARQFLSNSTNAEKYRFFNRGVQLEQLDQDYSLISVAIKNTEAMLETKKEAVEVLKGKLADAEHKMKQFESHDGLRAKLLELQNQMAWVQVRDAQDAVKKQDQRIVSVREKIAAVVERRDLAAADYEAADREFAAADEKIKEEEGKSEPFRDEKAELLERLNTNKSDLLGLQADQRQQRPLIQSNESKIREFERKIYEEEKRLEERNGGSSARLTESIDLAQGEIARLKSKVIALDEQHTVNQAELEETSKREKQIRERVGYKEQDLNQARELLHQLNATEKDSLSAFDRRMRTLVQEIERETNFRQRPVGPLGRYVTLLDNKWMDIVEQFFGSTLGAFVVTSHADAELLKRIMSRINYTVQFFVTAPKQINIAEPDTRYKTILRILEIADETARMQLIVGHAAEQAILIEDLQQANSVMKSRREGDNIGQCYALNAKHPGMGHKVGGAFGVSSVTPIQKWHRATRMAQKSNGPSQKENVLENITRIERELNELRLEFTKVQQKMNNCQGVVQNYRSQKRSLATEISRHEDEIDQLRSRIDTIAADGSLGVLQQEITMARQDKETYMNQARELEERKSELNKDQNEISAALKGVNQDLELAQQRLKDAEADKASIQLRRTEVLRLKNQWIDKETKYCTILAECQQLREELVETVESHTKQAQLICEPVQVPEGETGKSLDKRCHKLAGEIVTAEKALGGSKEECTAAFCALAAEYNTSNALCVGFDQLLAAATKVLDERKRRWGLFQSYISTRARAQFSWMMSERAFKGRLRLEHAMRPPELIIEVQPGGEATGNRGPKTLSGGEKSFSTICLLLSLWEAMGSPIRCLDEFDVFMDSVNRSISVKMMIKSAERSVGKQFVLITPQNMNQATSTRCKITRMPDPDRGSGRQTILT